MQKKTETFEWFGLDFKKATESEYICTCPFCDKRNHFYVNSITGQWSCKHCGEEGNVYTFLKKYSNMIYEETTREDYRKLAKNRGLPVKALRDWRIGWDGFQWFLPVWSEKKTCRDIRCWNPKTKRMKSPKGCKVQLYGWYRASKLPRGSTIFICEGEWDAIALSWLLARAGVTNMAAVGIPGANTFKDNWVEDLAGYKIVLCYDNDPAGEQGSLKAYNMLKESAQIVHILKWPGQAPKGYDVRDFIKDRLRQAVPIKKILKVLKKLLVEAQDIPTYISEEDELQEQDDEILDNPPTFEETLEVFEKWADMKPDLVDALKIMFAVVLSVKVPGDPLWIYIVGPAGSGKTMLLISLSESSRCIFQSAITAHTLVSGFQRNYDPSLLPKLNKKCCVWKDFTEVLERKDKDEIYSRLRGAFDGSVIATFGNGVVRNYKNLHFSMLAGTTPAVHGDRKAMLDGRFLQFEIFGKGDEDTTGQIEAAMDDVGFEDQMVAETQVAATRFLAREVYVPEVPDWVRKRIIALAQLTSILRVTVEREMFGDRQVLYIPAAVIGTRLAKQLLKLAQFLALIEGHKKVEYEDYKLVEKTAADTSKKMYLRILQSIQDYGGSATISQIAQKMRLNWHVIYRQIEDLYMLRVVMTVPGKGKKRWEIEKRVKALLVRSKIGKKPVKLMCKRRLR